MDHVKELREGRLDPKSLAGRKVRLKGAHSLFFTPETDTRIISGRKVYVDRETFDIEFVLGRSHSGRTMKLRGVTPEEFDLVEEVADG